MSNFDENDPNAIADFVAAHLSLHKQFALSTIDDDGKSWTVCVNLTIDPEGGLIWKSARDSEHSRHIRQRPDVSICVFSEREGIGDFGLYTYATARELSELDEIRRAIGLRYADKSQPPIEDFTNGSEAALYIATFNRAWVNDDRHLKIALDLDALREAL